MDHVRAGDPRPGGENVGTTQATCGREAPTVAGSPTNAVDKSISHSKSPTSEAKDDQKTSVGRHIDTHDMCFILYLLVVEEELIVLFRSSTNQLAPSWNRACILFTPDFFLGKPIDKPPHVAGKSTLSYRFCLIVSHKKDKTQ